MNDPSKQAAQAAQQQEKEHYEDLEVWCGESIQAAYPTDNKLEAFEAALEAIDWIKSLPTT